MEISRLRSELLSLESKTPPSCNKTEGRLENKRLRDEIVSLEKYVQILHKEQEELQTERDSARERVRYYRFFFYKCFRNINTRKW